MSPRRLTLLPSLLILLAFPSAILAAAPNAPTNLTVTALAYNEVKLEWADNSTDEYGFQISYRVGTSGAFTTLSGYTNPNTTTTTLNGTAGNTLYQFQIRAASITQPTEFSGVAGPASVLTPYGVISTLAGGTVGQPFALTLTTSPSGASSYSVSALPAGLSLDSATGKISGVPTTKEVINGTVTANWSNGSKAENTITARILQAVPAQSPPSFTPASAPLQVTLGVPATFSLNSSFSDPDVASAARLTTDLGTMDFAFFSGSAPQTVANFMGYLSRGDFVNTMFHRSVPGFIIQAGAFRADATASAVTTQAPVVNEPDITNARGTVAMAKVGGNPNSATNQFFINLADNAFNLNGQNDGFTAFARVVGNGMAVADAIAALPTKNYASVNSALTDAPVRGTATPPAVYDPSLMVRISSATTLAPLSFTGVSANPAVAGAAVTGTDLTITPATPGETTVSVTATDLDGLTVNGSLPVTVNDSFDSWAARQNFATPADAAATADPDGDGLINLVEFALASQPLTSAPAETFPGLSTGSPALTFNLRRHTSGVLVTLQTASDPAGPWTDQWKSTDGLTHPWIFANSIAGEILTLTAKDPAPLPVTASAREFMRLKVSQ